VSETPKQRPIESDAFYTIEQLQEFGLSAEQLEHWKQLGLAPLPGGEVFAGFQVLNFAGWLVTLQSDKWVQKL
jgi:hypothetical protein